MTMMSKKELGGGKVKPRIHDYHALGEFQGMLCVAQAPEMGAQRQNIPNVLDRCAYPFPYTIWTMPSSSAAQLHISTIVDILVSQG